MVAGQPVAVQSPAKARLAIDVAWQGRTPSFRSGPGRDDPRAEQPARPSFGPDREQFGEERLCAVLRENRDKQAAEIIRAVSRAVQVWMGYGKPTDDITSVVLRILE